jgi:tetratricopeptide (TPR) repeat protein
VDDFLTQASQSGRVNSSGEFTISHHEALRKLRDFQLPRVGAFASNLVASVVLAGGSRIHVTLSKMAIHFAFDKPVFSRQDLETLFHAPFQSGAPLWRKEMAIAANGTLGLPLQYLSLASWDGGQGWELKCYGGDRQEVQSLSRPLGNATQARISLHFSYQRGFKLERYSSPIRQELQDRCCHAPIDIRMNARSLNRSPLIKSTIARKVWRARASAPGAIISDKAECSEESEHEEPFSVVMTIDTKDERQVMLLVNGVCFPAPAATFDLPDWIHLVVAAPSLQKDLSQASVTMNDELRYISTWASTQLNSLLENRCRTFEDMDPISLSHFHACLNQIYPETRPKSVEDWFEHQELVQRARDPQKFSQLMDEMEEIIDPLRVESLWRAMRQAQWRAFRLAWSERDWESLEAICRRLQLTAQNSEPFGSQEQETIESACCLSKRIHSMPSTLSAESRDVLWSAGRQALIHWLAGHPDAAYKLTEKMAGFWKHYLRFQMRLPDLQLALPHLQQAISESFRASFALNDLVEIRLIQEDYVEAIQLRKEFLRRRPAGKAYWNQVMRIDARAHGTRTQFAYWTAYTGLAELTRAGQEAQRLAKRIRGFEAENWLDTLRQSESKKLTNPRWRFLFHRGLWALRRNDRWEDARHLLFRRLLLASFSEQIMSPVVPALTVL